MTSHPGSGLLGNLTGKTLTATFTITGTALVGNTLTLTVPLNTANWYDRGFEPASDVPTDFAAAVATVGAVGVSFGGGCGVFAFAGGAAPTNGTASFVLKSYSVS